MFDINNIFFKFYGYPLSYVELIGTIFGFLCVFWSSKNNILTWPASILSVLFLFFLFFQVQLYANMFLQSLFFIGSVYGWYNWKRGNNINIISKKLTKKEILSLSILAIVTTFITCYVISNLHIYFPKYFKIPSVHVYADSFTLVLSLIGTFLLGKRKIENWILFACVNLICAILYYTRSIYLISIEFFIFFGMSLYGYYNWNKLKNKNLQN